MRKDLQTPFVRIGFAKVCFVSSLSGFCTLFICCFLSSYKSFAMSSKTWKSWLLLRCLQAFAITSSLSEYWRNLAIIEWGLKELGSPKRWILWNYIFSRGCSILSFSSRNWYTTSLVFSTTTLCSDDPSTIVHLVFSGMPTNFRFSLLEYVSIYKNCLFKL